MRVKSFFIPFIVLFFLTVPIFTFAAADRALTPSEFLKEGAGVLIGEIVDVQVSEQEEPIEAGNVVVKVTEVLAGKVNRPLLNFPYQRQLGPVIFNSHGWDIVPPIRIGKKFIVYFIENDDGTYDLYPQGSNSVQEINSLDDPKVKALRKITGH